MRNVPFLDLKAQYASIKEEVLEKVNEVFEDCAFSAGKYVSEFEVSFRKAHGANHCIAVNSGTAALHAALWALDIGVGDEVIVPANTFIATAEAVSLTGAIPVFVDCEEDFYCIDASKIEERITGKTKAVIAVHLYGHPANLSLLKEITDKNNIFLVEDCAQAHLCEFKGEKVGTVGDVACFSFYPGKNLGAYGEGGAIVTNDEKLAKVIRLLISHGSEVKYYHDRIGHNYRMSGVQGAILNLKLKYLPSWTDSRINNAEKYSSKLKDVAQVVTPNVMDGCKHVNHLYVIQCDKRDELLKFLNDNGVGAGIHYPIPCHLQKAYEELEYKNGDFPQSERIAKRIISLPMFPELSEDDIKYVADLIKQFYLNN